MAETVLVTGGTGFVAGWCIVELLKRGYAVRATVRSLGKESAIREAVATQVEIGDRLSFHVADLTSDTGWGAAVGGCDYVLHVASPLGGSGKEDLESLLAPARDGALRVLKAAIDAGVKRVVVTSSTAAASPDLRGPDSLSDETQWTDVKGRGMTAYRASKALAEKAAWDFMRQSGSKTELTTVLPTAIFGPLLMADTLGSVQVISRLLDGRMSRAPDVGFSIADVRDVAIAHILAMTPPEAAGERFIATGNYMRLIEIAHVLREELGPKADKAPTLMMRDWLLRLAAVSPRAC